MTSSNSKKKRKQAEKASGGGDGGGAAKKKKVAKKKTPLEELNLYAGKRKAKLQKEFNQAGPNNIVSCKISYSDQSMVIEGMGEGKTKKLSQQQAATNILHQLRERGLVPSSSIDAAPPTSAAQIMITPRENNLPPLAKKSNGGAVGVDTKKKSTKKKSSTPSNSSSIDATTSAATASTAQSVVILMTPRENNFNEKTWWMVDINPVGGEDTSSSQGASTLVKRCMRTYGWDELKTKKILNAYRQFITLKKEAQDWDALILSPCYLVDQMWQCHILDVKNYCHDMMLLCGRVVGHDPDGAFLDYVAKQKRDETTRELLQKKFGSYDDDVWNYSPDETHGKSHMKSEENIDSVGEGEVDTEMTMNTTGTDMIKIWVNYQNRDGTLFKLKRTTKLGKVFEAYAVKKGADVHTLGFFWDGKRISDSDTPEALGLVDNGQIDVVYEQAVYPENVKSEGNPVYKVLKIETSANAAEMINIIVSDQVGIRTICKMKRTTKFGKLFHAYVDEKGLDILRLSPMWMVDGERIGDDDTPETWDLDDGDQISFFLQQCGC